MTKLCVGIKGICTLRVEERHTGKMMKSGTLDVFATPAIVALMEECTWVSIQNCLPKGQTTVGTSVQIKHIAPTPIGLTATCHSELIQIEGRKLTFTFDVFDDTEKIAFGTHERFIIDADKFSNKTTSKLVNHAKAP